MYITEQYHLYRLAYQLVFNDEYEVLHMNDQTGELWLEKYDRKSIQNYSNHSSWI